MNFTYYYHIDQSENLEPEYYTTSTITATPNNEPLAQWNENSCPSRQDPGGSGGGIEEIRAAMVSAEEQSDILSTSLMSLKDAGDTPELQSEVDNSTSSETMEIYTELINTSPYVSDTVIESVIIKEDVLPNALLRDVMVANPQSAKNTELVEAIDDRSNPMPDYMKAQVLQGKSIVGAMELLESEISYYNTKRENAFKNCVNWYLKDTLNPQAGFDSLLLLLDNESCISAKYQLVALQLERGNIQQANNILINIGNEFNLGADEEDEYNQMQNYFALLIQMQQNELNFANLTNEQLSLLEDLEENGNGKAKVFAQNIRRDLGLSDYEEPYIFPDMDKSAAAELAKQEILQSLDDFHYINVAPNPTTDYTIVEYILEESMTNGQLQITDISGKVLSTQILNRNQDQQLIDTRNYKTGTYLLSLLVDGKLLETVRLNVTK